MRRAETEYSKEVCGERIDHSVIHYWEKKLQDVYTALVRRIGALLITFLTPSFMMIDSTKFATWKKKEIEFHTLTAVMRETVLPISVFFGSTSPTKATRGVIVPGSGELMADPWYDDNEAMGIMFKAGYTPVIKPNSNRYHGHWRRKARKIFYKDIIRYRQRGRGESTYGSLTNSYGEASNYFGTNNKNKNCRKNCKLPSKALHKNKKRDKFINGKLFLCTQVVTLGVK